MFFPIFRLFNFFYFPIFQFPILHSLFSIPRFSNIPELEYAKLRVKLIANHNKAV